MLLLAGPLADGVIERTAERFELCFKVEAFFAGISRRLFDRVAVLAGFIALLPFLDDGLAQPKERTTSHGWPAGGPSKLER
jgi:hypothetical protein